MSKRPVAMNCFSGRDKLVGFACHPRSRSFLSQMQTRSKSRYDKFSNWSLFRHKTAICQKLTFHFTETLFFDGRQAEAGLEIYLVCNCLFPWLLSNKELDERTCRFQSHPSSQMPDSSLWLPGQPPTHQGTPGAHEAAEQNQNNPFSFTSNPHW